MIKAQGGIFGWVSDSTRFLAALDARPAAGGGHGGRSVMPIELNPSRWLEG